MITTITCLTRILILSMRISFHECHTEGTFDAINIIATDNPRKVLVKIVCRVELSMRFTADNYRDIQTFSSNILK